MKKEISVESCQVLDLCQKDPVMAKLIKVIGDLTITMRPDYFRSLVRSIVGQQISVAAASTIFHRLDVLMNHVITAENILDETDDSLRSVGLSTRKINYIRDLSDNVVNGRLDFSAFHGMENNQILKKLETIKGIGTWTGEMFLIFSLNRMNVLSLDDIGIQRGARWLYQVDKSYRRQILIDKAELWNPYYAIASFYLWEIVHLDFEKRFTSIHDIT